MKGWIFGLILVTAFLSQEADAADLTFYTGYMNTGGLNLNNVIRGLRTRDSIVYGGRVEFDFHRVFGLEETFGFMPNLVRSDVFAINTDAHGFLFHSNVVMNVPMDHIVPFATIGMGLLTPFGSGFQPFGTRVAYNYGGGVKLHRLFGNFGLRFDVRGYALPDVNARTLHMFEASGGLVYTFGGD